MAIQTATFGAGCFWCLEAAMNQVKGVIQALSGYMGGENSFPTYEQVCREIPATLKWCRCSLKTA